MTQQEKMFAMIEEWERSGQTKAAFARASRISVQTFHYWFRGYRQLQPTKSPPAFIELPNDQLYAALVVVIETARYLQKPARQRSRCRAARRRERSTLSGTVH